MIRYFLPAGILVRKHIIITFSCKTNQNYYVYLEKISTAVLLIWFYDVFVLRHICLEHGLTRTLLPFNNYTLTACKGMSNKA